VEPVDAAYGDKRLAALYDALNPWGPSEDFYLDHVMRAESVLDAGCGTGTLLSRARQSGHTGSLTGLDPAAGMLAVARAKGDGVTWVRGDVRALNLGRAFELITMTGHAFQVLLDDEDTRTALAGFHRHLEPGGRLIFEIRNRAAKAWQRWTPANTRALVRSPDGEDFEVAYDFRGTRGPDLVDYVTIFRSQASGEVFVSPSTLRFPDPDHLRSLLGDAGFGVAGWFGDWDRGEVSPASREIIVIAART
jgi:ubiquinone/menaquinone biosynthesis C-methylase UbiE